MSEPIDVVDLEKENTRLRELLRRVVGYLEDNLDSHAHEVYDEFVDELSEELS